MTPTEVVAPIRRILVALDASRASETALETAVVMAEQFEAELEGLYVEDINLLHLAGLPFSREVGLASARSRRILIDDMARAMRGAAAHARRVLEATAARRQVRCSFRVARGHVAAELVAAAGQADVIALATASREIRRSGLGSTTEAMLASAARVLLISPNRPGIRERLAVIYDGSVRANRALAIVGQLAHSVAGLEVLLMADDSDSEQRLRDEASAILGREGVAATFTWIVEVEVGQLVRLLREHKIGTLVVAEDCPGLGRSGVQRLLQAVDCAVVLLR